MTLKEMDPLRQFLESVWQYEAEARRRKQRAEDLAVRCQRLTARIEGISRSEGADQGDMLALWADARTQALEAVRRAEEQRDRVEAFVAQVEPPVCQEILALRYVDCHSWGRVRKELRRAGYYYSERHIYRLHEQALETAGELWQEARRIDA